ncbi:MULTISPECIES: helix-turn-helix domain-containing protein [Cupriavidus]
MTAHDNTSYAQRVRLLDALRVGPVDTVYASRQLDILHPPRRVFELREEGHHIVMTWEDRFTEQGKRHRVGVYSLVKAMPPAQGELL